MNGTNSIGMPEAGRPQTLLPAEPEVADAVAASMNDVDLLRATVAAHPRSSLAWALLADATFDPERPVESYAYARVGYHRGLDALRKAGWRGTGAVPWAHEPNRGVLHALFALRRAAAAIGETDEVVRLTEFLNDADPTAISRLEATPTAQLPIVPDHVTRPVTEAVVIRGVD
jgi:hypothetical protein